MARARDWSSLPAELVNLVADCLLATNDLDCYADLRAVCHHWRSATADPRSNQHDPRFRPTSRWVMLDDHEVSAAIVTDSPTVTDGPFLFVNTATGRFLRRRLPLRHHRNLDTFGDYLFVTSTTGVYLFVTSTTGGLIVLADRDFPHAVSVLNFFTDSLIRFAAPLPFDLYPCLRNTAVVVGSSPTLVLASVETNLVYWADPQSECFSDVRHYSAHLHECPASRLPQIAAAAAVSRGSVSGAQKDKFDRLLSECEEGNGCRCYAAVTAGGGDMLAVLKRRRGMDVFKIDSAGNVMEERVKSIGSQALFLGVRCLVVDTDCFPGVEPNCAYFRLSHRGTDQGHIYKFNIGIYDDEQEPELVSAAMDGLCMRPLTLTQLLSNYPMDIPNHIPTWRRYSTGADYYNYIDYVDDE